jgi:methylenetetrahydrofolate dehydrogenase (NADP+)/methenyltetrahydrofolate cyclohydrolase
VIGRSLLFGKPAAQLLLAANATVTMAHSKTRDLPGQCRRADILVAAIGRPGFVTSDFVKPGAAVVDVGTTPVTDRAVVERLFPPGTKRHDAFERRGSLVIGDVHPDVANVAGALSPVPGGAGPLTIALLLKNTLRAAEDRWQGR